MCVNWLQPSFQGTQTDRNSLFPVQTNTFHLVNAAISIRCSINYAWRCGVCNARHLFLNMFHAIVLQINPNTYFEFFICLVLLDMRRQQQQHLQSSFGFVLLQQRPHMHSARSVFSTQNLLLWIWIGACPRFDAAVALHWTSIRIRAIVFHRWLNIVRCGIFTLCAASKLAYWLRCIRLINYYTFFENTKYEVSIHVSLVSKIAQQTWCVKKWFIRRFSLSIKCTNIRAELVPNRIKCTCHSESLLRRR